MGAGNGEVPTLGWSKFSRASAAAEARLARCWQLSSWGLEDMFLHPNQEGARVFTLHVISDHQNTW
jgi:hypothetical protein